MLADFLALCLDSVIRSSLITYSFVGSSLGLSMHVFGTETHMTAIVGMALGKREVPKDVGFDSNAAANMFFTAQDKVRPSIKRFFYLINIRERF